MQLAAGQELSIERDPVFCLFGPAELARDAEMVRELIAEGMAKRLGVLQSAAAKATEIVQAWVRIGDFRATRGDWTVETAADGYRVGPAPAVWDGGSAARDPDRRVPGVKLAKPKS